MQCLQYRLLIQVINFQKVYFVNHHFTVVIRKNQNLRLVCQNLTSMTYCRGLYPLDCRKPSTVGILYNTQRCWHEVHTSLGSLNEMFPALRTGSARLRARNGLSYSGRKEPLQSWTRNYNINDQTRQGSVVSKLLLDLNSFRM